MPEISRFFGIIIRMFDEREAKHHRPHFHAFVQNKSAVIALQPVEILRSSLSKRHERFIEAWAELHEEELLKNWELSMTGEKPQPIEPLR